MSGAATHYLSAYASPPGPLSVIAPRHDQNIALWRRVDDRVDLLRVWELERVSGQKHHFWPLFTQERCEHVLGELLAAEGLTLDDISACWGTPGYPHHREIVVPAGAQDFPVHSLAHLFSGLMMSSRTFREETIVALAVDGRPDFGLDTQSKKHWYAGCVSRQGDLAFSPVESPAPVYDAATAHFGKEPGTLMALAEACPTTIDFDVEAAMESVDLFGGRKVPLVETLQVVAAMVRAAQEQLGDGAPDERFTPAENLQSAVMKHVQAACELVMVRNVDRMLEEAGLDPRDAYLSLSGGFALNCPTNSFLLRRYGFKGLLIPPSANDSGQALGLGLLALHGTGDLPAADFGLDSPYHGTSPTDVDDAIADVAHLVEDVSPFDAQQFVEDLTSTPLVWVDGASEIGPRALGHRSILADPREARSKDLLNEWKDRQWWRPVAPIVLHEHTGEWFDDPGPSPFMLQTATVLPEQRDRVPAILHLDDSARHQTLTAEVNPLLHAAIAAFGAATGVPMVCNTSLNEKGEPIVETAAQALGFALRKGAPIVYLCGRRVRLRADARSAAPVERHPRRRDLFADQEAERDALWGSWLAEGYSPASMVLMSRSPEMRDRELAPPDVVDQLAQVAAERDESGTLLQAADKHERMFGPESAFDPSSHEGAAF